MSSLPVLPSVVGSQSWSSSWTGEGDATVFQRNVLATSSWNDSPNYMANTDASTGYNNVPSFQEPIGTVGSSSTPMYQQSTSGYGIDSGVSWGANLGKKNDPIIYDYKATSRWDQQVKDTSLCSNSTLYPETGSQYWQNKLENSSSSAYKGGYYEKAADQSYNEEEKYHHSDKSSLAKQIDLMNKQNQLLKEQVTSQQSMLSDVMYRYEKDTGTSMDVVQKREPQQNVNEHARQDHHTGQSSWQHETKSWQQQHVEHQSWPEQQRFPKQDHLPKKRQPYEDYQRRPKQDQVQRKTHQYNYKQHQNWPNQQHAEENRQQYQSRQELNVLEHQDRQAQQQPWQQQQLSNVTPNNTVKQQGLTITKNHQQSTIGESGRRVVQTGTVASPMQTKHPRVRNRGKKRAQAYNTASTHNTSLKYGNGSSSTPRLQSANYKTPNVQPGPQAKKQKISTQHGLNYKSSQASSQFKFGRQVSFGNQELYHKTPKLFNTTRPQFDVSSTQKYNVPTQHPVGPAQLARSNPVQAQFKKAPAQFHKASGKLPNAQRAQSSVVQRQPNNAQIPLSERFNKQQNRKVQMQSNKGRQERAKTATRLVTAQNQSALKMKQRPASLKARPNTQSKLVVSKPQANAPVRAKQINRATAQRNNTQPLVSMTPMNSPPPPLLKVSPSPNLQVNPLVSSSANRTVVQAPSTKNKKKKTKKQKKKKQQKKLAKVGSVTMLELMKKFESVLHQYLDLLSRNQDPGLDPAVCSGLYSAVMALCSEEEGGGLPENEGPQQQPLAYVQQLLSSAEFTQFFSQQTGLQNVDSNMLLEAVNALQGM